MHAGLSPVPDASDEPQPLDFRTITLAELRVKHPERVRWESTWTDYRLLYKGGEEMIAAAGEALTSRRTDTTDPATAIASGRRNPRRRFLFQLDGEPHPKYLGRLERAVYINEFAPIIDFFTLWLFSQQPTIRPSDSQETPAWYQLLAADCDGKRSRLLDFLRDRFREALITRWTGWAIGTPDMATALMSQAEAEENEVDGVRLTPYVAEEISDWEENEAGD